MLRPLISALGLLSLSQVWALTPSEKLDADKSSEKPTNLEARHIRLAEQRVHYELAKSALEKKDWQEFGRHYDRLGDYPLLPYLDYSKLKSDFSTLDFAAYDSFLAANQDSFLELRFRQHLLYHLGLRQDWQAFDRYYRDDIASVELQCFHLRSRLAQGDSSAFDAVPQIWISSKSLPKVCDPLFDRWKATGGLSPEVAWQRFNLALNKGNTSLARYVRSAMDSHHASYAELMLELRGYPSRIRKRTRFQEQSAEMQQVIAYGVRRYARFNPRDALKQWEIYEAQQLFPEALSTDVKMELAKRLTRKDFHAEAETLIKGSEHIQKSALIEQQIRSALEAENWPKVLDWLDTLEDDKQASDRWLYWRARAQAELGILAGPFGHFVDIYAHLAQKRSFYGFLAADKLGTEYAFQISDENVQPDTLVRVANLPAMRRARELWLTGATREAQAEWAFATRSMDRVDLLAAGSLARTWGWYNGGINAMISGNHWDQIDLRFPLAYKEQVERAAQENQLEPQMVYAIARQESAFSETARSSAGAMGLMQLMPGTARQTAKKAGVKHRKTDLYKAEHNLHLGSHYFNQLLQRYEGNRILAAAAYNAGPHRVNRWLKERGDISFDVWIETIPFSETRGYVQNVLSFSVIYAYRMGKQGTLVMEHEAR